MKVNKILLEHILAILEKDFFDVDDSAENEKQQSDADNKETATSSNLSFNENDEEFEPSETLQLKFIWANLIYLHRIARQLASIDEKYDIIYEKLNTLYRIFTDFITHYESFEPEKRERFIKLFRLAFIETIQELKQSLK